MKIMVTGATGMVGSEVIRQAVLDDRITSVVSVVRREVVSEHPKVKHVVLGDFIDYAPIAGELEGVGACLFCLGIARGDAKSAAEYERITVDFAVARAGYEGMKQREVKIPPEGKMRLNETLQRLAQLYDATQRPEQAVEWRKKLAELETDKK